MVGIFTGSGSGLERGSANILGAAGLVGSTGFGRSGEQLFLNAATGNLLVTRNDEFLVGLGPDAAVDRTYNSLGNLSDENGDNWRQSTDRLLFGETGTRNTTGATISRRSGDGSEIVYTWNSTASAYVATDGSGAYDTIAYNSSTTTWTWTDGDTRNQETYEQTYAHPATDAHPTWRIKEVKDRSGVAMAFAYVASSDHLDTVTTSDGAKIQYSWSGNNITKVVTSYTDLATSTAKTLTRVWYEYTSGRLTKVRTDLTPDDNTLPTDAQSYWTSYAYDSNGRVSTIVQKDGSSMTVGYDGSGRVTSLTQAATGSTSRVTYLAYSGTPGTSGYTTITDPTNQVTRMDYDAKGNLTKITAPAASTGATPQTVEFGYDATTGDVTSRKDGMGNTAVFTFNNGNMVSATDRLGSTNGQVVTRTYGSNNELTSETRTASDATGNAVSITTRYAYDSHARLRYMVSGEGYVTEYRYTSAGLLEYTIAYPEQSYPVGTSAISEAAMDTWRNAISDLQSTHVSINTYDARGGLTSTKDFGYATSGSYAAGGGVGTTAEGYVRTVYTYDQAGRLLSRNSENQAAETFVYDGMGRMTASTDINGGTTTFVFNDTATTTTVTLASGYATINTYNLAGDLISQVDSGSYVTGGTTNNQYDKLGRLRIATDAVGLNHYYAYDKAGRLIADVNSYGDMVEYRYDADNRLIATARYATRLTSSQLAILQNPDSVFDPGDIRPSAHAYDMWSWNVYDAEGRTIATVDGDGSYHRFTYDKDGRLLTSGSSASKLTSTQVTGFKTAPPAIGDIPALTSSDPLTRYFYDRDGRAIGTLDAEGYLTRIQYDKAGQKVAETAFFNATGTAGSIRTTGSFNDLVTSAGTNANDRVARYVYDGAGQLRYSVDGLNQVTSYSYDSAGLLTGTTGYAAAMAATSDYTYDNVKALVASLAANTANRTSWSVRDIAGRIAFAIDGEGDVTGFTYDNRGQVTRSVRYAATYATSTLPSLATMNTWSGTNAGGSSDRITRYWYSARGEVRYTVDGEGYVTRNDFNADGQMVASYSWDNKITVTNATAIAQVETLANASGTYVGKSYIYHANGKLYGEYDGNGVLTLYDYYSTGLLAARYDAYGTADQSVTVYAYDGVGRLTTEIDASGTPEQAVTSFTYNGLGDRVTMVDPRGVTSTYTYDKIGQLKTETDGTGALTSYEYDAFGDAWKATDARSNVTYNYYDAAGRLVATRDAESYVTSTSYNAFGEVASVTRHSAHTNTTAATGPLPTWSWIGTDVPVTTSYEYDKLGNLAKVTDPMAYYQQFTYNAFGEKSQLRDERGMLTSEAYDRRGLLKTQVVDTGTGHVAITTGYTYNARGQVLTATDANGKVTTSTYDAAGRLATVKDALNNTTAYAYDGRDNLVAVTDARLNVTRTIYDANDRRIATIDARGGVVTYTYDAGGNLTVQTEYKNRVSTTSMGTQVAMSTLTSLLVTSADDRVTRYAYDDDGHLRFTVDAQLHVVEMEYDAAGNVVRSTAYDGVIPGTSFTTSGIASQVAALTGSPRTTRMVYDALGRLTWSIDALGHAAWFYRDALDHIVKQVDYSVAYTASGNPTIATMTTWQGSAPVVADAAKDRTARAWFDPDGRMIYSLDALGFVTRTDYDAGGNVTATTRYTEAYSASDTTLATHLATFYGAPVSPQITQYTYDTAGRLTETLDAEGNKTRLTLRQDGQVWTSTSAADTSDAHLVTYTYDDVGRVSTQTVQIGTSPSSSDLVTSYTYDAVGNRIIVHDARTNDTNFYYDELNRQVMVHDPEGIVTETTYTTFGEVASVIVNSARAIGTPPAGGTPPGWSWSGTNNPATTLFEYDTLGQLTKSTDAMGAYEQYGYGNLGERLSVRNKLGGTSTYTYDRNGRVLTETLPSTITTKNSGGTTIAVVNRYEYDAYGNRTKMVEADGAAEMRTTVYTYDKLDRLSTTVGDAVTVLSASLVESSYTPTQTLTYDSRGNVIKSVDADAATFFYYDRNDRLIAQISPVGTLSTFAYDHNGNKASDKMFGTAVSLPGSPGGTPPTGSGTVRETRYAYDRANRLVSTTIPSLQTGEYAGGAWAFTTADIVSSVEYDATGNVTREVDGRGNSVYHWYDKAGREVARIDQENYLTVWIRDAEGNATQETRYANKVTGAFTSATAASALTGLLGSGAADANRVTDFTYDKNGRRLTETRESVAYFAVDSGGTMTSGTTSSTIAYTYDGLGNVLTKVEANNDTTTYTYDAIGRFTLETGQTFTDYLNNAATTPRTSYIYDGLNNLKSTRVQVDATGTNAADRVTSYTYGAGGRLATVTDAMSQTHVYGYDKAGRTVLDRYDRVKSGGSSVTEARVTLYDLAGRVTTQTNARLSGTTWLFTSELTGNPAYDAVNMQYNAFGDLTGRGISSAGGTAAYQEQFWYDGGGRLWKSNSGDGVLRFHLYDKAGNETLTLASTGADLSTLTGLDATKIDTAGDYIASTTDAVTTITVYDKRGQATSTREPDRQVAGSTTTITHAKTYNAFGEVLSETDARGYATSYSYNTMGRMVAKVAPSVSATAADGTVSSINPTERYYYDISGRLVGVEDANSVQAHASDPLSSRIITKRLLLAGTGHGDGEALVTKEFHPDTGIFETKYDVFGDARVMRNELNSDETHTYDKLGNIDTVTHRGGHLIDHYSYDILGQRTKHWITESGTSTIASIGSYVETTDYDAQGRVVSNVLMGGDTTTYRYTWNATLATSGLGTFGGWDKLTINAASMSMTESQDYFGRTVGKTDYGSHATTFTFDKAGRQLTQSQTVSSVTATITNTWFNTGLLATTADADGSGFNSITSTYVYDATGNRTYEGHTGTVWSYYYPSGTSSTSGVTLQNTSFTYDALNRLSGFVDKDGGGTTRVTFANAYDANGNVMTVTATYPDLVSSGSITTARAYRYDTMNRMVKADWTVSGSTIIRGAAGKDIAYDLAGRRVSAAYDSMLTGQSWTWIWYPDYDPATGHQLSPMDPGFTGDYGYVDASYVGTRREQYSYTADGYLTDTAFADSDYTDNGDGTVTLDPVNYRTPVVRAHNARDALGRVSEYLEYDAGGGVTQDRYSIVYTVAGQVASDTVSQVRNEGGVNHTYLTNTVNTWLAGGRLSAVTADNWRDGSDSGSPDTSTAFSYGWWDDARITVSTHTPDVSSPGTTFVSTYYYDPLGRLAAVDINDGRRRTASFAYTAEGQVLRRDERSAASTNPQDQYLYLGGMQVGFLTNNGNFDPIGMSYAQALISRNWTQGTGQYRWGTTGGVPQGVFGQGGYDPINPATTDDAAGRYTVRAGDTLASIAASLWGDASLWYMLAEANGLAAASSLAAGQTLSVPNKVTNVHNSSSTFRPYDPNHALGDLSPTTPKTPKANKCGVFGQILQTIVTVAVSMVTGNPLIGNIAGQLFGMATGIQQGGFNWKSLAITAITMALTAGLSELSQLETATKGALALSKGVSTVSTLAKSAGFLTATAAGKAIAGMAINAATQGIAIAAHLQKKFDFAETAAAGVSAGMNAVIGGAISRDVKGGLGAYKTAGPHFAGLGIGTAIDMASAIANAGLSSIINGNSFGDNIVAALPGIIGQTIGNEVAGGIKGAFGGSESPMSKGDVKMLLGSEKGVAVEMQRMLAEAPQEIANPGPITSLLSGGDLPRLTAMPSRWGTMPRGSHLEGPGETGPAISSNSVPDRAHFFGENGAQSEWQWLMEADPKNIAASSLYLAGLNNDLYGDKGGIANNTSQHGDVLWSTIYQAGSDYIGAVRHYNDFANASGSTDLQKIAGTLNLHLADYAADHPWEVGGWTFLRAGHGALSTIVDPVAGFVGNLTYGTWNDLNPNDKIGDYSVTPLLKMAGTGAAAISGDQQARIAILASTYQLAQNVASDTRSYLSGLGKTYERSGLGITALLYTPDAAAGATTLASFAYGGGEFVQGLRAERAAAAEGGAGRMFSSGELMGIEPASPDLLAAIGNRRSLIIAEPGSSELKMLDYFGAEASVGTHVTPLGVEIDNGSILLRQNPSKAAALEEFLHGTQAKLGITERLGRSGMGSAETHVKDFMIRHQSMLGLSNEDVAILKILKDKGL